MNEFFENNVFEVSTTEGTGPFALAAVLGYRRFSDVRTIGNTAHYMSKAVDVVGRPTGAYEYGIGTYSAANTLTRTTILGSSNAGAAVNWLPGTKTVVLTMLAPDSDSIRFNYQDALGLNMAGAVQHFAMSAAPQGWIKCNGAAISRAVYARLWSKIGTLYGTGDGSTSFNLPDLRGEFIRGWDDGRTLDNGRGFATVQGSQNLIHAHGVYDPTHTHAVYDPAHTHGAYTDGQGYHDHANGVTAITDGNYGLQYQGTGYVGAIAAIGMSDSYHTDARGNHAHNVGVYAAASNVSIYGNATGVQIYNDGGGESRPRNVALLTCIKY